jgi:hypothetical protein
MPLEYNPLIRPFRLNCTISRAVTQSQFGRLNLNFKNSRPNSNADFRATIFGKPNAMKVPQARSKMLQYVPLERLVWLSGISLKIGR